jgi:hypothetical protein
MTCHPLGNGTGSGQNGNENCTVFQGPIIFSIAWLGAFFEDHDKGIVAAFTVILALSTIGLWLSTNELWQVTKKTLDHTEGTAKRELRAYVFAKPYRAFNIYAGGPAGAVAQTYTTVGNKGRTFAKNVQRSGGINILSKTPEKFEDLGPLTREEGVLVLAPDQEGFIIRNLHSLSQAELDALMTADGELRIYAYGRITYEDAFGESHTTTYCHAYYGVERARFEGIGPVGYEHWQAKYADRHNEAD